MVPKEATYLVTRFPKEINVWGQFLRPLDQYSWQAYIMVFLVIGIVYACIVMLSPGPVETLLTWNIIVIPNILPKLAFNQSGRFVILL